MKMIEFIPRENFNRESFLNGFEKREQERSETLRRENPERKFQTEDGEILLTSDRVAKYYGIHKRTVNHWANRGWLKAYKINPCITLYSECELRPRCTLKGCNPL